MNLKPYLICQMCTKILKNPITLACGHTLCEEHLQENKALNENKLECVSCNQVYDLNNNNNNHIVRVQILQEILREKCFLSNEEKECQSKLAKSFTLLNQLNREFDEYKESFAIFEMEFYENFQEIRRQIDIHRENEDFNSSRTKIDNIALDMIDRTKAHETPYYSCLNENIKEACLYQTKSINVDDEKKKLEEMFRDPNILLATCKQMELKQMKRVKKLKSKIDEMIKIRKNLATNYFRPIDNETFGILKLNDFPSHFSNSILL